MVDPFTGFIAEFHPEARIESRIGLEYYEPLLTQIIEAVVTNNVGYKELTHFKPDMLIPDAKFSLEDGKIINSPEHICLQLRLGDLSDNSKEIIPHWNEERIRHLPLFIPLYIRNTTIQL